MGMVDVETKCTDGQTVGVRDGCLVVNDNAMTIEGAEEVIATMGTMIQVARLQLEQNERACAEIRYRESVARGRPAPWPDLSIKFDVGALSIPGDVEQ